MSGSYPYGSSDPSIYDNDPGYYDDEPDDPCDHDEYEIDILTGRAECSYCPHSWYASSAEIDAVSERHRRYDEWHARESRRESVRRFFAPITGAVARARQLLRRKSAGDDDLPF